MSESALQIVSKNVERGTDNLVVYGYRTGRKVYNYAINHSV